VAYDIRQITAAIGTMSVLLDDLVELSRTGHVISSPEKVSLGDLVQDIVNSNSIQITRRDIEVRILPELPTICVDRVRLREVLQNIFENSIKFMGDQPDPQIEIGARDDGTEVVCYISDNGSGIDPAYHEKIFGLFDRLDLQVEGTGVGLALAHRIIGLHDGSIWVESDGVGKGSTFFFTIPKAE
jgi:signal transduction histidine kinase